MLEPASITILVSALLSSGVLVALITYWQKRPLAKPEATTLITNAASSAVAALSSAVSRLEEELEDTRAELEKTRDKLTKATAQNELLLNEVAGLREQVAHLTRLVENQAGKVSGEQNPPE